MTDRKLSDLSAVERHEVILSAVQRLETELKANAPVIGAILDDPDGPPQLGWNNRQLTVLREALAEYASRNAYTAGKRQTALAMLREVVQYQQITQTTH